MITLPSETRAVGSCILVVDDDEGVRENLAELFGLVGYSVLTAANATEAMEALRKHAVDLLLTDYRMPGPNGVELGPMDLASAPENTVTEQVMNSPDPSSTA